MSGRVFGQSMQKKKNGNNNYQSKFGGRCGTLPPVASNSVKANDAAQKAEYRRMKQIKGETLDQSFGIERFAIDNKMMRESHGQKRQRRGWLYNMTTTTVTVSMDATMAASGGPERSGLDLYFLSESGAKFKSTILYRPYFYVLPDFSLDRISFQGADQQTIDSTLELLKIHLARMLDGIVYHIETDYRIDLDQTNHLSPKNKQGRPMLKLIFDNVSQLMDAKTIVRALVNKNSSQGRSISWETYTSETMAIDALQKDPLNLIVDLREYDVPYVVRVCTDLGIRAGTWYTVRLDFENVGEIVDTKNQKFDNGGISLLDPDNVVKAEPTFLAFDIECTKAPLKFPSAEVDEIFMISYMVSTPRGGEGYLIVSRSVVSQDIGDFEYTPKPNLKGPFKIFNEDNEQKLLERFFSEYRKHCPQIVVTYNGDFFDWPYVETRAKHYGIDMFEQIGVEYSGEGYRGRCCVHMDAFHWVQRDSYLPQGAQGLKAVTKYKLKYDPVEVDPEDMVKFAKEKPVHMATYSVSDAVATYYLYENYVHLFIFSLCTIIPMGPEDVLCKGSGTLCEMLLMVEACNKAIICPNKQTNPNAQFHNGHLLESETYIGGKVECLETGVYRSDLEYDFDLKPAAFQELINNVDRDLTFAIHVEGGKERKDVVNYDQIRTEIVEKLELLRDRPKRKEKPYVYHLDVGAMYPNIILTNRLQPYAIVNDSTCAACDFNQAKNECKRRMEWIWRGDYSPASFAEYERTKDQLSKEKLPDGTFFNQLPEIEQSNLVAARLKTYANRAYRKTKITEEQTRTDIVCMRENDFYVDTVRQFRDRRYEYKRLNKTWNKKLHEARDAVTKKQCEDRILIYDSLQVAHKCILNSFYGYVMRKGARWRSMEMAGIVTKTGSDIITQARLLVEQIGRPLELDTDGIWCILPVSFPDVYTFEVADGSKLKLEYPCVMLNADVHAKFTNNQYQDLVDPVKGVYESHKECSIFFEVDGPYRCMVLPASIEEGRLLKKRYAVFNFDGSLAELKGFELKRRGELELIKTFQSQVFERFLDGSTLQECYDAVAEVANHWLDVIDTRGESLEDDELIGLVSENRSMSRQLDDYGDQKGTSQTTARRLSEFLGAEIVKDKGLNCKFIIAEQPFGAPVTERAIPTAIWRAEPGVMKHYLRKWLKAPGLDGDGFDIRNILDWDYYFDRLGKTIQKIITIPAALQKVSNPVPRIEHPAWLTSQINVVNDRFQQQSIKSMFQNFPKNTDKKPVIRDIEDIQGPPKLSKQAIVRTHRPSHRPSIVPANNSDPSNLRLELTKDCFPEWLKQKKAAWKNSRIEKKDVHRSRTNDPTDGRPKKSKSVQGFARDAAISLTHNEWQIVEVREMSSFDSLQTTSSGEFMIWTMVGTDAIQKVTVAVPRIIFLSTHVEARCVSDDIFYFRKVDKHLPHSKTARFLYEVSMPEHIFKSRNWINGIQPLRSDDKTDSLVESMFESRTPLLTRLLCETGSVCKLRPNAVRSKNKTYSLEDIVRVDRPIEREYLHSALSYRQVFLYVRINQKTRSGIVALFITESGSGSFNKLNTEVDLTRPAKSSQSSFNTSATSKIWIVKPNSRNSQRNISLKQCETLSKHVLQKIHESQGADAEYACISQESVVNVSSLNFVDAEELALAGANESINSDSKSNPGAILLLLNSTKSVSAIRRHMSTFSGFPVLSMTFPPGPAHDPVNSTLPALNWEQPALQLSLEAYLYILVVSFPKRVSYARYGHVPIGNLGGNENVVLYEVCLSRLIQKNRALLWANPSSGRPDLGMTILPTTTGATFPAQESGSSLSIQDEIWSDDDELVSPVIRKPGCYRTICVDIDVQDLTIAALTSALAGETGSKIVNPTSQVDPKSPNSVTLFGSQLNVTKTSGIPGDEMATEISLPILRALISGWLKDAFASSSVVADELLHHVYQFLSNPDILFHDPALHRVVHSLMKSSFLRLLTTLQHLGCVIVFASFHKIVVATNKILLAEAEEYMNFVIGTVRRISSDGTDHGDALSKITLQPRQFHSHFVFLDEYNFGTIHLERNAQGHIHDDTTGFTIPEIGSTNSTISTSVVTAWSMINYLRCHVARAYFRAIIGKFSNDVFKEQMQVFTSDDALVSTAVSATENDVTKFKKDLISNSFASYLTRAVGEIMTEGMDEDFLPPYNDNQSTQSDPTLEFVKSVIQVLSLDNDVEDEVQALKRSLFAQLGIAEYSSSAIWKNPCPTLVLPDVFCTECHESRDINLCHIPPSDSDEEFDANWICEDCGMQFSRQHIEARLVHLVQRKIVRYQLQDLRCSGTNRVATRTLACLSQSSATLKLDISQNEILRVVQLVGQIAKFHQLEVLQESIEGFQMSFT